eukprot:s4574_g5.t1
MELCEPLDALIDLSAEFHEYAGGRYIITIVTASEKPPQVMGFRLLGDDEVPLAATAVEREDFIDDDPAPMAPEDEIAGVEIEDEQQQDVEGQAICHGQIVLAPGTW